MGLLISRAIRTSHWELTLSGWSLRLELAVDPTTTLSALATDNERLYQEIDKIFYNDFSIVLDQEMGLSQENCAAIKLLEESIHFEILQKYSRSPVALWEKEVGKNPLIR